MSGLPTDDVALVELERRWALMESGEPTIPHEAVGLWLYSWGTPEFRPWRLKQE